MQPTQHWLAAAAQRSLGDIELTDALDATISAIARDAHDDPIARDALFICLAAKIERFTDRFRGWDLRPWSLEDVRQETYLVFAATLASWQPSADPAQPAGFLPCFLRVFPRRLAERVRLMLDLDPQGRRALPLPANIDEFPDPLTFEPQIETLVVLDAVARHIRSRDAAIVYLRVVADAPPAVIATHVGADPRTVRRRLARITPLLRLRCAS